VQDELRKFSPLTTFDIHPLETTGDRHLSISLRSLGQTDFFTKEIDELVLQGHVRIGIHSAKDLPDPIPKGLQIIALTRGVDPSDSLVFREHDFLDTLPAKSVIATSSLRREQAIRNLRPDFTFCDVRGPIHNRLNLLEEHKVDGIVIAEAALIRLKLTHWNRLRLPGKTAAGQGQLAIVARKGDAEMEELFRALDARLLPEALYLGPEPPIHAFCDRRLIHCPLIQIVPRSLEDEQVKEMQKLWPAFTHVIMTSKSAVREMISLLRRQRISLESFKSKTAIAVGSATAEVLKGYGITPHVAEEEQSEGIAKLIQTIPQESFVLWPHSAQARNVIQEALETRKIPHFLCPIYDVAPCEKPVLPDLNPIPEVIFSSPSTVRSFFNLIPNPPNHLQLTPIGPITAEELAKYSHFKQELLKKER
jgi:hydroxymethylbilane synthase